MAARSWTYKKKKRLQTRELCIVCACYNSRVENRSDQIFFRDLMKHIANLRVNNDFHYNLNLK